MVLALPLSYSYTLLFVRPFLPRPILPVGLSIVSWCSVLNRTLKRCILDKIHEQVLLSLSLKRTLWLCGSRRWGEMLEARIMIR